jgi:hypothetical protein
MKRVCNTMDECEELQELEKQLERYKALMAMIKERVEWTDGETRKYSEDESHESQELGVIMEYIYRFEEAEDEKETKNSSNN